MIELWNQQQCIAMCLTIEIALQVQARKQANRIRASLLDKIHPSTIVSTTLPSDLDILTPSLVHHPCVKMRFGSGRQPSGQQERGPVDGMQAQDDVLAHDMQLARQAAAAGSHLIASA